MIDEWQIAVDRLLISSTPSGYDWALLDYCDCGPQGEPAVVYADDGSPDSNVSHRVPTRSLTFSPHIVLRPRQTPSARPASHRGSLTAPGAVGAVPDGAAMSHTRH